MTRVARIALTGGLLTACLLIAVAVAAQPGPSTATFRYDANGNLVGKSQDGVELAYVYDVRDLLIEVRRDGLRVESYRYDHQDRRISRTDSSGAVTRFLWDDDRLVAEQDASGATIARYTYDGERPLALEHTDEGRAVYLLDALGSPVSLSRPDGTLAVRYRYDAWGAPEERAGDSPNPIGLTGHLFDVATGLYYARARYYDPDLGRFLTVDPFEGTAEEPRSLHPYLYGYANPTSYVDRDGRCVGSLQESGLCQAISRFLENQVAGDPLAIADRDVAVHQLVMDGRSRFRAEHGREPLPHEVVATTGATQFTAGFEEIDTSGRVEADHLEWSLATVGVGGRLGYAAARGAGATTTSALGAGARQAADDALGEVVGVSPSGLTDLHSLGSRLRRNEPPSHSTGRPVLIVESPDGGVDLEPLGFAVARKEGHGADSQILSAYPRTRRVAGTREGPRPTDPARGFREAGAFDWSPGNVARMERGQPPLGMDGRPVELHHRHQNPAGPLDELTASTHQQVAHPSRPSMIDRDRFAGERRRYWIERVRVAHGQPSAERSPP